MKSKILGSLLLFVYQFEEAPALHFKKQVGFLERRRSVAATPVVVHSVELLEITEDEELQATSEGERSQVNPKAYVDLVLFFSYEPTGKHILLNTVVFTVRPWMIDDYTLK